MLDLVAWRITMAARMDGLLGGALTNYPTVPGKPETPCTFIRPGLITVHATLDPDAEMTFDVQLIVQLADFETAQNQMDALCSLGTADSIADALEANDPTISVDTIDPAGTIDYGGVLYGSVTFHGTVEF